MLGLGDQALRALDAGIEDAMAIGHKLSLCNTLMQAACPVALLAGDLEALQHALGVVQPACAGPAVGARAE